MIASIYTEYGAADRRGGWDRGAAPKRDDVIAMVPRLAADGFKAVACCAYPGVFKDHSTCRDFWEPVYEACRANNLELIPGTFLHLAIYEQFGPSPDGVRDIDHPLNPVAFAFRDPWAAVKSMRATALGAVNSNRFYLDCEYVFNHKRRSMSEPVYRMAVTQRIREMCRQSGPRVIWYHPFLADMYDGRDFVPPGGDVLAPQPYEKQYAAARPPEEVIKRHIAAGAGKCWAGFMHRAKSSGGYTYPEFMSEAAKIDGQAWFFARSDQLRAELRA